MCQASALSGQGVGDHLRGDKCLALRVSTSLYAACFSISQFLVNSDAGEKNLIGLRVESMRVFILF